MFTRFKARITRAVASLTAVTLLVGTAAIGVAAPAAADVEAPTLVVSKSSGLNPEGETITVTGTGYNPNQPIYVTTCTDIPLSELTFGFISAGCTSGAKQVTLAPSTSTQVQFNEDGSFETEFVVAPKGATTAVYTLANRTAMNDRSQDAKQTLTFAEPEPEPSVPTLVVSKSSGLNPEGETITVTGTGYNPNQPIYVTTCTDIPLSELTFGFISAGCTSGAKQVTLAPSTSTQVQFNEDGSFETEFVVAPKGATTAVYTLANRTAMNDRSQDAKQTLTFAEPESGDDGDGTDEPDDNGKPEEPKEEDVVQQQAGKFAWGFKESFRNYIKSNIAHGEVKVASGAVDNGDFYTFQQDSNSVKDGKGTVSYTGSVQFTGHDGDLDSKFSNPQIKLTSANAGEISFEVNSLNLDDSTKNLTGQRVVVAQFTGAKLTTNKDESVSYMASNVTLTADGSRAFSNFYQAGDALDAITFTIGANKSELPETDKPGTDTGTDTPGTGTDLPSTGAVAAKKAGTYKQAKVDETSLVPGGRFTITADGFGSNTKNIELYVYSEPVLLKKGITANANGVVTVTATLPENLPAGTHTLSLEAPNGVIQRVSIEVLAVDAIDEGDEEETSSTCVAREISGATLSWGVKQSYVNYVSRLSDGKITTSGVTQSGDAFLWSGGTGKYNEETSKGLARFGGSLNFTGHAGIMDTTFRNVRVQFHGTNSASIVADIVSNSVEGETSSANAVYLATISLAGNKSVSGNKVTWSNAPVTLTAAGANAFGGFYEAGQAMDPATVSITLGAETDCDTASGTALGNTGVEGIQAGLAAAIFLLLAGTVAVIANRRYTVQQR